MSLLIQRLDDFVEAREITDEWQILAIACLIRVCECSGNDVAKFANVAHVNATRIWIKRQSPADGSVGWALPLDPDARCIHMGDISELGNIVAGAFAHPDQAGDGEYLPLVGDFTSFNEIVETLNQQGREFSFKQVPKELFATLFPGAAEIAETFSYFQAHTYLGSDSSDRIALGDKIAGRQPTKFATWAQVNFPA